MVSVSQPFRTYCFGKLGRTLESARQTGFFQWFHLFEPEHASQEPARLTRFQFFGDKFRLCRILALFGLAISLCACHKPVANPELSLKGTWNASGDQVTNCGNAVPVTLGQLQFVIRDAPLLNQAVSSFDLEKANVNGTVTLTLHMEGSHPLTVASGILVGEIVNGSSAGSTETRLQGYILSEAQYGAWVAKNKKTPPPPDAGEVDLAINGNAAQGYSLSGEVRSSEPCGKFSHLDAVAGELTGHFGRSVPAEWSAKVRLQKAN